MNLKHYYSQKQAMDILGFDHRMQIYRWRRSVEPEILTLCKKPFYLRKDVDAHMEERIRQDFEGNLRWTFEQRRFDAMRFDIDLDVWLPRCEALKIWPWSHELLYAMSSVRNPLYVIRTRKAYDQHFFYRPDIQREIEKSST